MPPLIECVPNFSEGRDPRVIDALVEAVRTVPGVALLDVHRDAWHHRSVLTFAGEPEPVAAAAFATVRLAVARIDLNRHRGEHPRMGAADVVPFVPLEGATMDDCIALARSVGERIGAELAVPVFLYGRAASRDSRAWLPGIRRRGYEELVERVGRDPAFVPDFGPARLHPTAGATAVGARPILVAFNVALDSGDIALARQIARQVRESDGGLPGVQAKGFLVDGRAQVSMNLLNVDVTPPFRAFRKVQQLAGERGVDIAYSEIVGLAPARALPAGVAETVKLATPVEEKILERRLEAVSGAR